MEGTSGIQYDDRGRPYIDTARGRNYISPVAMGQSAPEDTTGMFRKAPQWNQRTGAWETPLDFGNMLTAGTIAGLTAGAGSAFLGGGAAAAGAGGGGAAAGGSAATAAPLGGLGAAGGVALPTFGGAAATGGSAAIGSASAGTAATTGTMGTIGKILGSRAAGAIGTGLGAASQSMANNRSTTISNQQLLAALLQNRETERQRLLADAQRDEFNQGIARQQEGRASGSDAWRKLLSSQRTLSPGAKPQLAGPYNVAPRQATDTERAGASAMSDEVMARLTGGNPLAPVTRRPVDFAYDPRETIDERLAKAGKAETAMGWLSPILSYLGQR